MENVEDLAIMMVIGRWEVIGKLSERLLNANENSWILSYRKG